MKKEKLLQIIGKFSRGRIAVLGDFMLDHYIYGQVEKISPEAPIPVLLSNQEDDCPGGAGNTAHNLSCLGASVLVFGVVGKDESGKVLKKYLHKNSIDIKGLLEDRKRPTTKKSRVIAHNQHVVRIDKESCEDISKQQEDKLINNLIKQADAFDVLVFSDYNKGLATKGLVTRALKFCRDQGKKFVVDAKPSNYPFFKGVDVVTPNLKEARKMSGQSDPVVMGETLRHDLDTNVLLTQSENGMTLFEEDEVTHFPVKVREVYDIVGAGDTVLSTLALALACGASMKEASFLSNCAAGIVVGKKGTSVVSRDELHDFINSTQIHD